MKKLIPFIFIGTDEDDAAVKAMTELGFDVREIDHIMGGSDMDEDGDFAGISNLGYVVKPIEKEFLQKIKSSE